MMKTAYLFVGPRYPVWVVQLDGKEPWPLAIAWENQIWVPKGGNPYFPIKDGELSYYRQVNPTAFQPHPDSVSLFNEEDRNKNT